MPASPRGSAVNFRLWSARGAICFAPLVIAQVVVRNWDGWEWWPFWADDLAAAALLIAGGYFSLASDTTTNSRLLTGAWFFSAATQWAAMFGLLSGEASASVWEIVLILVTLLGSVAGTLASLPSKRGAGGQKPAAARSRTRSRHRAQAGEEAGEEA